MLDLRQFLAIGWLGPLLLMLSAAAGQSPAPEPLKESLAADETQPRAEDESGVQEVGPTILVVRDKDGKLHPSPDLTLEALRELEAIRQGLRDPDRPPRFHFDDGKLSGTVFGRHAELQLELAIVAHDAQWVRAAVGLKGAVLVESKWIGPGTHFFEYDEKTDGHIAWIRAGGEDSANTTHTVQMKVLAPLAQVADQTRLELALPRANLPRIALRVKAPNLAAAAGPAVGVVETIHEGGETEFRLAHAGGDLRLTWNPPQAISVARPAVFEATGKIIVRAQGPTRIVWDAVFTLNVHQGELSTIKLRLPPRARLAPIDDPGVRIIAPDEGATPQGQGQVLTIELDRPLAKGGTREVRLTCERILDAESEADVQSVEIAGFEVLDAKQSGHIGIVTNDDWRADTILGANILRDSELPAGFREAGVQGSDLYRYAGRPNSLLLSTVARQKKTIVAPTYVLRVGARRASLETRLDYRVLGGRAADIYHAQFGGWSVDKVELVQKETAEPLDFAPYQTQPLAIDLPRTLRGDFEVRITAHYELPVDVTDFAVDLPLPLADEREPAIFVVQPDNNVELQFLPDTSAGLTAVDLPSPVPLAKLEQKPAVYLERLSETPARFATAVTIRTRQISVASAAVVRLEQASASIEQRFDYQVRYEPVRSLRLLAPAWLQEHQPLTVSLDGEPLSAELFRFQPQMKADAADLAVLEISLPEARIGPLAIEVAYRRDVSPLEPTVATAWTIDLLQPNGDEVNASELTAEIQSAPQIRVELSGNSWRLANGANSADENQLRAAAKGQARRLELITTYLPPQQSHTTVVQRLWLQTWLTATARQDRAVFQVRTNSDRVLLEMPANVSRSGLVAIVDGVDVPVETDHNGPVVLTLPDQQPREQGSPAGFRTHVIELWHAQGSRPDRGRVTLNPPRLVSAAVRQVYWHVVTPGNELAFYPPAGMSSAMDWVNWWQRPQPALSQRQLEQWVGASEQASPAGSDGFSGPAQYLFSSVAALPQTELKTYSAGWVMLALASAVLGAGMALVYVRALRHPAALLVAAVVVIGLASRWPSAAMVLAQSALLAAIIVLFAQGLEQLMLWRRRWGRVAATSISQATTRRHPTTARPDSVLAAAPSTTATAAVAVSLPGAEAP